jgi:hypothetical protein
MGYSSPCEPMKQLGFYLSFVIGSVFAMFLAVTDDAGDVTDNAPPFYICYGENSMISFLLSPRKSYQSLDSLSRIMYACFWTYR